MLVCIFAAWLHLTCGVSWNTTARVLKFFDIVLNTADTTADTPPHPLNFPRPMASNRSFLLPHDVCTAIRALSIEPQIIRYICCPKCFCHHSLKELAEACTWCETPRSKPWKGLSSHIGQFWNQSYSAIRSQFWAYSGRPGCFFWSASRWHTLGSFTHRFWLVGGS